MSCLFAAAPSYADVWTLTKADFTQNEIDLIRITPDGMQARAPVGNENTAFKADLNDVVSLSRDVKAGDASGLVLCTVGGGRLVGQPRGLDGQTLRWFVLGVGDIAVPLDQVLGVLRNRSEDDALTAARDEDEIRLQNGDVVRGIVTAIDDKTFTVTPAAGEPVTLSADVVSRLLLAAPAQGRAAVETPAFVLRLTNGSVMPCAAVTLDGDKLRVTPYGNGAREMPAGLVVVIEHTGGRVRWLVDRLPTEAVDTPYFGTAYAHRIGRSVTGGPIRFGGRTYDRGVGVHSYSRLTYAVDGDRLFRTQYATADGLPYADLDVRILVDGKIVHEQKSFRTGTLSPVIEADVRGAKTLTLEVDFGNGYDVQDRLNWINPAFVRE